MHCIFLHGTGGTPDEAFFPWTRKELEKKGHKTSAPIFPSAEFPDREGWIEAVREIYDPEEKTVFIGRSLGGTLIPYLLEQEDFQAHISISIAAPLNHLGWDNLMDFFSEAMDFEKAKASCEHFYHWYSDDDPYVPLDHGTKFQELLGGEYRVFEDYSHFYNLEFPEIVETLEKGT